MLKTADKAQVWGLGENNRRFRQSGSFSWQIEDVQKLLDVATGVKLDTTICKNPKHVIEKHSLVEWRNCSLCGKLAQQVHCRDTDWLCPQYDICVSCGR
jgi:hypothetical protein